MVYRLKCRRSESICTGETLKGMKRNEKNPVKKETTRNSAQTISSYSYGESTKRRKFGEQTEIAKAKKKSYLLNNAMYSYVIRFNNGKLFSLTIRGRERSIASSQ